MPPQDEPGSRPSRRPANPGVGLTPARCCAIVSRVWVTAIGPLIFAVAVVFDIEIAFLILSDFDGGVYRFGDFLADQSAHDPACHRARHDADGARHRTEHGSGARRGGCTGAQCHACGTSAHYCSNTHAYGMRARFSRDDVIVASMVRIVSLSVHDFLLRAPRGL